MGSCFSVDRSETLHIWDTQNRVWLENEDGRYEFVEDVDYPDSLDYRNYLPLKDGLNLNLQTWTLEERTQESPFTDFLPYTISENLEGWACKHVKQFLGQFVEWDDDVALDKLLHALSNCVKPITGTPQIVVFRGSGNNGKTTLIWYLEKVFGTLMQRVPSNPADIQECPRIAAVLEGDFEDLPAFQEALSESACIIWESTFPVPENLKNQVIEIVFPHTFENPHGELTYTRYEICDNDNYEALFNILVQVAQITQ